MVIFLMDVQEDKIKITLLSSHVEKIVTFSMLKLEKIVILQTTFWENNLLT